MALLSVGNHPVALVEATEMRLHRVKGRRRCPLEEGGTDSIDLEGDQQSTPTPHKGRDHPYEAMG